MKKSEIPTVSDNVVKQTDMVKLYRLKIVGQLQKTTM